MNGHENMDSTNTWISSRTLFKTLLTVFIQNVRLTESKSTGLFFFFLSNEIISSFLER